MKKVFCSFVLCALLVLQYPTASIACGDKFLVRTGGVSKALACCLAAKPAAILIFRDPNNKATVNALDMQLELMFTKAGHDVRFVDNQREFESVIKNNVFDVILLGYAAAGDAEKILHEVGKKAKIVPVVDNENETEIKSAKAQYGDIIKSDDQTNDKVLVVAEVLLDAEKFKKT